MASRKLPEVLELMIITVFIILSVLVVSDLLPLRISEYYICPYCSIRKTESSVMFGSMHQKDAYQETKLSRYWHLNINPHHKHTWRLLGTYKAGLFHPISSSSNARTESEFVMRSEDAALVMLKSLPTPASREAVMLRLCNINHPGYSSADRAVVDKIIDAYNKNPSRKDWPVILRRFRLTP